METVNQELTHIDQQNNPQMVDVSDKAVTKRTAVAQSIVHLTQEIVDQLTNGDIQTKKGPVFHTAIIAGTMAAKKTSELIPFCHPIGLDNCKLHINVEGLNAVISCTCSITARTGVEMEALTGASVAALTIYDMCKAMSHHIEIQSTKLVSKTGGKQDFKANG